MSTILERIVAAKREEIASRRAQRSEAALERALAQAPAPRDFLGALMKPQGIQVIAEVKKASPSAGTIRGEADVVNVARTYERAGAACISVLTDGPFFHGSLEDLEQVRAAVSIPILRKDFVLERYQVLEARAAGADAVLLIAEILEDAQLTALLAEIEALGMTALVECYEASNLRRVIASGARLIGINNRNLHTFETRLEHTLNLAAEVPAGRCLVSESGIRSRDDVARLQAAGIKAILVGEALMRAPDPAALLQELRGS